jgi:hypothetical protein
VVFLSGITFAFIETPALGWSSPAVLTMALLGVIGLAVFLTWERHAASPMLPLSIFAQRQFAAVNAVAFIVYAALTGATFLLPVVLQVVSGYSPLGSGLALLPLTIIMLVLSGRSGQLAARIGPRLQLSTGPLVVGAGRASDEHTARPAVFGAVATHQDLEHALKAAVVRLRRSFAHRIETGYTSCPSRSASRAVKSCRPPLGDLAHKSGIFTVSRYHQVLAIAPRG